MIKFGYITELDLSKGMVRVNFTGDGIVSNLLPVSVPATKEDKYSFPFVINEHVWCLMDENCEFGVVGGAVYSNKDTPPTGADEQTIIVNINAGKLELKIDRQTGDVNLITEGKIKIQNSQTGLKELVQMLKNFIESIKVTTPAGPSVNLITPTAIQLTDLQTKIDNFLS